MDKTLRIMTYNSTGLASDKQQFINDVLGTYSPDVIFLQETWLLNSRINPVLCNINDKYMANGVSAISDDEILIGRPYGGVGVMWKRSLAQNVKFRKVPGTKRACALEVDISGRKLLLVYLYMPVDNQRKHRVDVTFMDTLDSVEVFLEDFLSHDIIIGGDMNLDLTRCNAHDMYFKDFMEQFDLIHTFHLPSADNGYIL